MRRKVLILISALLIAFTGCAPRGETRTLDEVLKTEKGKYEQTMARAKNLAPEMQTTLKQVSENLDKFTGQNQAEAIASAAKSIDELLTPLVSKAGYPSRPAMGELISQYRNISEHKTGNQAAAKLLASRTYSLLASELEGVKFAL